MTYSLGMVGTTFRRAGQAELQRFTLDVSEKPETLRALHEACGFNESVYLATCNRVEIVFTAPPEVSVAECRRRLHAYFHPDDAPADAAVALQMAGRAFHAYEGDGAAEHLFVVSAALDSMNPGEAQILGQVKAAYKQSHGLGLAGPQLGWVFEEAFSAAKKVRHDTHLGSGTVSMLSLAKDLLERRLGGGGKVLAVVGVGDMARQCGAMFQGRADTTLVFINRTVSRAEALAQQFGGRAVSLEAFLSDPLPHDVLVTSTASPQPLFGSAFFAKTVRQPLVVDLALQRDVEPAAAARFGAELYDIDRLRDLAETHRSKRHAEVASARALLDEALAGFRRRLIEREMAPVVTVLRQHFQSTFEADLTTLFTRVLPGCDAAQQQEVRRWAQTLVNRLAHVPTVGLKRIAVEHGSTVVEGFLEAVAEAADGLKGT